MSLVVWLLNQLGLFFLEPGVPYGWGKYIWSSSIHPSKTQVLWKVFYGWLPTDQHIQNKGLHICMFYVYALWKAWGIYSTFFFNILMCCIFEVWFGRFFLLLIFLIRMILFLLLRVMVVLWLIWLSLLW